MPTVQAQQAMAQPGRHPANAVAARMLRQAGADACCAPALPADARNRPRPGTGWTPRWRGRPGRDGGDGAWNPFGLAAARPFAI